MSSNLAPYNFTITDQSPLFQYSPYRDGLASGGWNASYASGIIGGRIGNGPSSHSTTFVGATAQLNWVGTAIYLYGEGLSNGYTIDIDGTTTTSGVSNTPGLLFSQSGLTYAPHSLILRVVQSGATISNAIITVGMGEVGSTAQSRTIQTTTVPITTNGFVLSGTWYPQTAYGPDPNPVPRIGTNVSGSFISFSLTSASAFYISGSVNENHGPYDVKMTPTVNIVPQMYNGSSHWAGLNTIMYLAAGMDSSTTYQVVMTNDAPDLSYLWVDLSEIVVFDAPPSQPGGSPSQTGPQPSVSSVVGPGSKHVGIGLIVGVAAGGAFILLVFLAFLFYFQRRRRRQDMGQPASFTTEHRPLSVGNVPTASYPTSWVNYSPEVQSRHSSAPVWAVDQYTEYRTREGMESPHGGLGSPVPSTSPTNAHSERTWVSGPIVDHYEHSGQPRPVYVGSGTSRPSTSTEWRVMSVSDRSSVPSVPLDHMNTE